LLCSLRILKLAGLGQLSFLVTDSTEEQICCVAGVAGVWELKFCFIVFYFYLFNKLKTYSTMIIRKRSKDIDIGEHFVAMIGLINVRILNI